MHLKKTILLLFLFFLNAVQAATSIQLFGTGYAGENINVSITDVSHEITIGYDGPITNNSIYFSTTRLATTSPQMWIFNFGEITSPGLYYTPFSIIQRPSTNISLEGLNLAGWFDIKELQFGPSGNVNVLAVDFYQHNNGPYDLHGSIRLNSSLMLSTIPEPSALLMLISSSLLLWRRSRK